MSESKIREFNLSEMKFGNTELSENIGRDLTDTLGIVNKLRGSIKVFSDAEKGVSLSFNYQYLIILIHNPVHYNPIYN